MNGEDEKRLSQWSVPFLKELMDERFHALEKRLDERTAALGKALELQASEYQRRLDVLNHAHEKAVEVQHTYVTQEKYEENIAQEAEKREIALTRVNEKFDDYVKRYEARQREVDLALGVQKAAAEHAQRVAEDQGRKSNRNLGIATLALGLIVAAANYIPSL